MKKYKEIPLKHRRFLEKANGKPLTSKQKLKAIKMWSLTRHKKILHPFHFAFSGNGGELEQFLPWPCDGCNQPPNKHPNKKCDNYWVWNGAS